VFPTAVECKLFERMRIKSETEGMILPLEGALFIAHNTPAKVERLEAFSVGAEWIVVAQVTIGAGPLWSEKFWTPVVCSRNGYQPGIPVDTSRVVAARCGRPS